MIAKNNPWATPSRKQKKFTKLSVAKLGNKHNDKKTPDN